MGGRPASSPSRRSRTDRATAFTQRRRRPGVCEGRAGPAVGPGGNEEGPPMSARIALSWSPWGCSPVSLAPRGCRRRSPKTCCPPRRGSWAAGRTCRRRWPCRPSRCPRRRPRRTTTRSPGPGCSPSPTRTGPRPASCSPRTAWRGSSTATATAAPASGWRAGPAGVVAVSIRAAAAPAGAAGIALLQGTIAAGPGDDAAALEYTTAPVARVLDPGRAGRSVPGHGAARGRGVRRPHPADARRPAKIGSDNRGPRPLFGTALPRSQAENLLRR